MATANLINANTAGQVSYDGAGTFSASPITQNSALVGGASNAITSIALTNGRMLIGNTGSAPTAGLITGTAISVTVGAGTLALAVTGGGFTWNNTTGATQTVFSSNGFIANRATQVAFTMNATNLGDCSKIVGFGVGGWRLSPTGSQIIYLGNRSTTVTTGYLESTDPKDCVEIVALSSTVLIVTNSVGNITVV